MGDLDKSKLKGLDALNVPGEKEGEVKMVRSGENVDAYQVYHFSCKGKIYNFLSGVLAKADGIKLVKLLMQ